MKAWLCPSWMLRWRLFWEYMYNLLISWIKDGSYDVRRYAAAKWVSTMVRDCFEKEAKEAAFYRLYEYVNGNNDKGIQ